MAEAYSWPEGSIAFWTGSATASAVVGYAQNSDLALARGWENRRTLSGNYYDLATGQRVDLNVGAVYTSDATLARMFDSATAVHVRVTHYNPVNGTAGFLLYSGRIDALRFAGTEGTPYTYQLTYHANQWSAY
jgi:hypothetical protein